jgi:hypothetical protein
VGKAKFILGLVLVLVGGLVGAFVVANDLVGFVFDDVLIPVCAVMVTAGLGLMGVGAAEIADDGSGTNGKEEESF